MGRRFLKFWYTKQDTSPCHLILCSLARIQVKYNRLAAFDLTMIPREWVKWSSLIADQRNLEVLAGTLSVAFIQTPIYWRLLTSYFGRFEESSRP